ncbi:jg1421 [Pararge aegeria aegeria]|uniref:Jg1421 protein n=2 Tax=Pararge aegeria TaxID=116150 RepID=A0A8S4RPD2_9NEOP|nr:jg1421 [Pararge aegeria aegeria]
MNRALDLLSEYKSVSAWQLMRCVVGADLGHAALQQMVELLRAAGGDDEGAGLARGAVFYINMALWGPRRVHTLHVSYLAVLPAFLKVRPARELTRALAGRHQVVAYEVVLALESLVARVAHELHEVTWDLLLDIVRAVLQLDKSLEPPNELIHSRVHALITAIEQLHDAGQYRGDPEALLDLVDSCGHDRPEASAMRLVSARLAAPGAAGAALRMLCRRCATLCRQHAESAASPGPAPAPPPSDASDAPAPTLQVNDAAEAPGNHLQVHGNSNHAPEVKRQNSAENNKSTDPIIDALNQFTQRFEKMSKEVEHDGAAWARVGELAAGGACPCWCARWAELHVRSPTGDVSWLLRMQNHVSAAPAPAAAGARLTLAPSADERVAAAGVAAAGRAGAAQDMFWMWWTRPTARHTSQSPSPQTSSDSRVVLAPGAARDELPPLARSKRSNTISVMSPTRRRELRGAGAAPAGGVSPSFVFLQLYHNMSTFPISPSVPGEAPAPPSALSERPLKVSGEHHERTIKNLDLVPPVETYKVGVLYVGPGQQDDEVAILKNEYGSVRYMDFLRLLGTLVPLEGAEEPNLFLNLEKGGKDGRYTYVWNDDIMQVLFHVATAMPSSARDPHCNEKRKYIGNDFVSIVYNDSGHDFNILTIKGHFNLCIVLVEPLEHGMNRITLKSKDERLRSKFLAHVEPHCVSDPSAPLLARQHALHAAPGSEAYASNSLERLRLIKRLRARAEAERQAAAARAPAPYAAAPERRRRVAIDDFNDYT